MRDLLKVFRLMMRQERWAMLRGAALSVTVLVAGLALLGLSGWFIVAAGAAGLAGAGLTFDVFRPSAGVRFLALGRTAARYGERILTHDATLKVLALMRVRVLSALGRMPFRVMERQRGALTLNRLTRDVDALDGVALRLVFPFIAGGLSLSLAVLVIGWLVNWTVALALLGPLAVLALLIGGLSARAAMRPSRFGEEAAQAFRARVIDHLRGRDLLAVQGRLDASREETLSADSRARAAVRRVDAIEQRSGALVGLVLTGLGALALWLAVSFVETGTLTPAQGALAFFALLATGEVVMPLRRAVAEFGRMRVAARRVAPLLDAVTRPVMPDTAPDMAQVTPLVIDGISCLDGQAPLSLTLERGSRVALVGASGAGKTTLLHIAAGLLPAPAGRVHLCGVPLTEWAEQDLRARLAYLPQRSRLMAGTIRDTLRLAAPEAEDAALIEVLEAVALWDKLSQSSGLDMRLGEGGTGLSGGERRRLALARVLLRKPLVLLLDEPTEGLDAPLARRVLEGITVYLPQAAILVAAHRAAERDWADTVISL